MGRNSLRYSDDQRQAIAQAVLDQGVTAREAVERARAGELGVAKFEVPVSTAQRFVTQAKDARPGAGGQTGRLRTVADRAMTVIEAELEKAEARSKRGSLDLPRIKRALQAAQHLARLEQILAAPTPPPGPSDRQTSASARLLERMQEDLAAQRPPSTEGPEQEARQRREAMLADIKAARGEPRPNGTTLNGPETATTPS